MTLLFLVFLISFEVYAYSSKDLIYYSKDFYGEDMKVIAPNIEYPADSNALDGLRHKVLIIFADIIIKAKKRR